MGVRGISDLDVAAEEPPAKIQRIQEREERRAVPPAPVSVGQRLAMEDDG